MNKLLAVKNTTYSELTRKTHLLTLFFSFIIMRPPRSSEKAEEEAVIRGQKRLLLQPRLLLYVYYVRRKKKDSTFVCVTMKHTGRLLYHFSLSAFVAFV